MPATFFLRLLPLALATLLLTACGGSEDAEPAERGWNVVPHVRLGADRTGPRLPWPWPREAEDAIATVRDDDPETGWLAPVDGVGVVTLDLLPWLDRPLALSTLHLSYRGDPPSAATVRLLDGCGGEPRVSLPWTDVGRTLDLQDAPAGCVELAFTTPAEGSFRLTELSLRTTDETARVPEPPVVPTTAVPGSTAAWSGVVEGFYGVPWSWRERADMVRALARGGLGLYVYAPKDDPLHRSRWKEPYPPEEVERFAELARVATAHGVALVFGISPFLDFDASDDADYLTLLGKLETMTAAGIHGVAILADDIETEVGAEIDGALGRMHASVAARLYDELRATAPDLVLLFVPTVYSDERLDAWLGGADYLGALRDLDPGIRILWTGPGTSNTTMAAADLERFTTLVGRRPLVWDNFWANDGGDGFQARLLLAPFSGRSPDLPTAVEGFVINPMIQGALSRLDVATFAAYLARPDAPDADAARREAARAEASLQGDAGDDPARDEDLLQLLMQAHEGHSNLPPHLPAMDEGIDAVLAALEDPSAVPLAEAAALLPLLARLTTLDSEVWHGGLAPDTADELAFPLLRVRYEAEMAVWALVAVGEKLAGRDGAEAIARAQEARQTASTCRFVFSQGKARSLVVRSIDLPPADVGFVPPAASGDPLPPCAAGETFAWSPFTGASETYVSGLPGASVADGTISWTPPRAGRYRAAVAAIGGRGWATTSLDLVCR